MSDFTRISELGQSSRNMEQPQNNQPNIPQQNDGKNVTMPNYSDLLSSMKSEMNQIQAQPTHHVQPTQAQPTNNEINNHNILLQNQQILGDNIQHQFYKQNQQLNELREAQCANQNNVVQEIGATTNMDAKYEAIFLVCICALVQMPSIQKLLISKLPSMYDNSKLTIVGVVLNSVIISVAFVVAKKLAVKYSKEF